MQSSFIMPKLWLTRHQQTDVMNDASKAWQRLSCNQMNGFPRLRKMVKNNKNCRGKSMLKIARLTIFCACISLLLGGCRASPLYIGSFGQQQIATAPGAVPRDGRGEPIMADLPPLGALPASEVRRTR
jgi:hypothetical protein